MATIGRLIDGRFQQAAGNFDILNTEVVTANSTSPGLLSVEDKRKIDGLSALNKDSVIKALTYTPADVKDIPTEATLESWGFSKDGGYSVPDGGIPKSDLSDEVKASLNKADTALQKFTEEDPTVPSYVKEITEEDISNWNEKQDIIQYSEMPDLENFDDLAVIQYIGVTNDNYENGAFYRNNVINVGTGAAQTYTNTSSKDAPFKVISTTHSGSYYGTYVSVNDIRQSTLTPMSRIYTGTLSPNDVLKITQQSSASCKILIGWEKVSFDAKVNVSKQEGNAIQEKNDGLFVESAPEIEIFKKVDVMPTKLDKSEEGKIYQYLGETNDNFIQNAVYLCVDPGEYQFVNLAGGGTFNYDNNSSSKVPVEVKCTGGSTSSYCFVTASIDGKGVATLANGKSGYQRSWSGELNPGSNLVVNCQVNVSGSVELTREIEWELLSNNNEISVDIEIDSNAIEKINSFANIDNKTIVGEVLKDVPEILLTEYATPIASPYNQSGYPSRSADKAFDGDLSTGWGSNGSVSKNYYIGCTFENSFKINHVEFYQMSPTGACSKITIEYTLDGETWINHDGIIDVKTNDMTDIIFDNPIICMGIRFRSNTFAGTSGWAWIVNDIKLFGKPAADSSALKVNISSQHQNALIVKDDGLYVNISSAKDDVVENYMYDLFGL